MVTIKDLAHIAKVSPTTISNVLHGKTSKVSPQTLKKVQDVIEETKYVSNMGGRLLARHGSRIIGVIITYARRTEENAGHYPFYSEIIGALEEGIRDNGYYMMLYTSGSIEESLNLASAWDIEGLIVIGNTPEEAERFEQSSSVPIVFIDTYGRGISNVGIDDRSSMRLLVNYLIELGHKQIAFVTDSAQLVGVDAARYQGFEEAIEAAGLTKAKESLIHISFRESVRHAMLKELISKKFYGFSALCFTSDFYACDALSFFYEQGIKVPEDISITGFDGNILAQLSNPKMTTIRQDVKQKGTAAVSIIIDQIKNESTAVVTKDLTTKLVEGNTVKYLW